MGNESSALVDEGTSPETLETRSIESVAKYIKEKTIRRIVVMVSVDEINSLRSLLASVVLFSRLDALLSNYQGINL